FLAMNQRLTSRAPGRSARLFNSLNCRKKPMYKRRFLHCAIIVVACVPALAAAVPTYTAIDLGTLGGAHAGASAINDSGQIAGGSTTNSGNYHAYIYSGGVMTDLGALGGNESIALGINNAGEVTGGSFYNTSRGDNHDFLYSIGIMTDLGTLGGTNSVAYDINDLGQITGMASTPDDARMNTFLYSDGIMTSLGDLMCCSGRPNFGIGINNSSQIVAETHSLYRSYLLTPVPDAAVPEPGSLLLLATALGGVFGLRRKENC
ncbi:MAG: PEP-CTERM sorting domain-containing protein, partial [Candidatus Accumulibacter phosphatis]